MGQASQEFNPTSGTGGWTGVNIGTGGILGSNYLGFKGLTFDGRYLYFASDANGGGSSGYIARYDTTSSAASYVFNYSGFYSDGISSANPAPTLTVNTATGPVSVQAQTALAAGTWQHIAATYDGTSKIKLYLNGALNASQTATGLINSSTSAITLGALTGGNGQCPWAATLPKSRVSLFYGKACGCLL